MTPPNLAINVRIVGMTDVGLVREHNEDNFLVVDLNTGEKDFLQGRDVTIGSRGSLLVVCDGMGGAAAGEVASQMAVDVILREMTPSAVTAPPAQAQGDAQTEKPADAKTEIPMGLETTLECKVEVKPSAVDTKAAATPPKEEPKPAEAKAEAKAEAEEPKSEPIPTRLTPRAIDNLLSDLAETPPTPAPEPVQPTPAPEPAPAPVQPAPTEKETPPAEASAAPEPEKPATDNAAAISAPSTTAIQSSGESLHESEMHALARKLRIAATKANQEIYDAACADIAKAGMGTTLTGLLLLKSHVIVAQVGDSRAYMWRKGKLTQITHDQSLVNQLLDSGQITPEQAKLFEHSNVILQALGVQEDVEVVLSTEVVRRDDRLLLCSDGLVGVVSDEEIQDVLTTSERIEEAARRLIDLARAGGGPDNITVIVAQVMGDGVPVAAPTEEVLYRPLYLDGEKPPERRVWAPEYGYIGSPLGGRDLPSGGASTQVSSRTSVVAMSAVLALLCAGIVAGIIYHKQPVQQPTVPTQTPIVAPLPVPPPPPPQPKTPLPEAQLPTAIDSGTGTVATPVQVPIPPATPTPIPPTEPVQVPVGAPPQQPEEAQPEETGPATAKGKQQHHPKRKGVRPGIDVQPVNQDSGAAAQPKATPTPTPTETPETPETPEATPEKPAKTPEKPAATPEKPTPAPEKPAPEKPAQTPEKPAQEKPAPAQEKPVEKPAAAPAPATP